MTKLTLRRRASIHTWAEPYSNFNMAGKTAPAGREYPVMSSREIEALVADGKAIVIKDQHVLKVDAWIKYHPGGHKAILHMVGRDATDEVNAFVPPNC